MKAKNLYLATTYILLSLLVAFAGTLNAQNIRYVKPTATGTGDGSSWTNASADIQAMINASAIGNQVWIASGTYLIATTLEMKNGVNVYGGFLGTETNINARPKSDLDGNGTIETWEFTNATILDGQNARRVLNQANPFAMETTWDGVTITKGTNAEGAGAYIRTNGKLLNCIINRNTASNNYGGSLYNNGGIVSYCNVSENTTNAWMQGCGIYNNNGIVSYCNVYRNTTATSNYANYGIYNNGGIINYCTINENGYGISNNGTVNNCTVSSHQWTGISGGTVNNSTVSFNQGGGISSATVNSCIIKGNSSYNGGGLNGCIANNCLIINNTATNGGGAYAGTSTNCTFVGNMATGNGGGMVYGTAINCIFWINNAVTGFQIQGGTVTYSAVQGGFTGTGNISIASNNDNGGAMFVNPTTENYQLSPCSPCVNKGSNTAVSNPATATDLAGNARIYQYSINGIVDIGAYELQSASGNFNISITSSIQGNNLVLGTNATFPATYLWSTGATTSSITVATQGNYWVEVTNNSGCSSTDNTNVVFLSETICAGDYYDFYGQDLEQQGVYSTINGGNAYKLTLTVLPSPPTPTITQNGLTLTSSSSINNQWYFNYEPIPGATGKTYQCAQRGWYMVVVSNTNGCFSYAETLIEFIPETEMTALKAIYQSTNGDEWTFPWDINNPYSVGSWHGVYVSDGNVTGIDLKNNNLTGTLPANLGALPYLDYFDVSNNKIGGNLPNNISGINKSTNLYLELYFSNNNFTGSIPSCYNILSGNNLWLNVSKNRLSSLETPLNRNKVTVLDVKNQEVWSNIAVQINPGMDAIISLPNLCTYRHSNQDFAAKNTFSVYLEEDNIGVVTSQDGIVIVPAIMLANAMPGASLTLVQSTGDAQGTKIRYNQGANPGVYSIKGKITLNGNPLGGVTIMYEDGYSVTSASGSYTITVDRNATVTLTPSLSGYAFTPSSITCSNVLSNLTNRDFTATSTTGIDEIPNIGNQITVFPNPAKDDIFIKSELQIEKVEIYSLTGALKILENNFNESVSVSELSKGVYLLKVYTDKGVAISKVIKD